MRRSATAALPLRLALRRLAAAPAFALGAVVLLALGTGATLAIFAVLDALVLNTLPIRDPGRLVAIEMQSARGEPSAFPPPLFGVLSERQRTLDRTAGVLGGSVVSAEAGGHAHRAIVDGVTAHYFDLFEVPMVAGRALGPSDYHAGGTTADAVAVVSEAYARRTFGAVTSALGATITLGETAVPVIGIVADRFTGTQVGVRTDIVVPAPIVGRIIGLDPGAVPLRYVFGRLADDRTIDDVRAEWLAIWQSADLARARGQPPPVMGERRLVVTSGATGVSWSRQLYEGPLRLTMLAGAWLFVIACANLAGLQFARALRREREIAVSRALGAAEWDVMAPTLVESFLLCLAGIALGAPLARWGAHLATELLFSTGAVPLDLDLAPDWSTWAILAGLTALVTAGAGLLPAWLAGRKGVHFAPGSRVAGARGRFAGVAVAGQVALAVVLLSGAALAVGALLRASWRDHGFSPDRIVAAQLVNRPGGYTNLDDEVYYRALIDRVSALPGVSAVALTKPIPATSSGSPTVETVGWPGSPGAAEAALVMASPGYFDVLGLSLRAGRAFDWSDAANAPAVAVVSNALARDLMPEGFRSGVRIDVGRLPRHHGLEVIGVVEDASVLDVRDAAPRVVYVSTVQQPPPFARWPGLIVRAEPGLDGVAAALAPIVDALGHELVVRAARLPAEIGRALARERLLAAMALVYGVLAIAMVGIGLWSLLAQDVTGRVRELGVRLSIGASPAMLYRDVGMRAARLTAAGVGLGAAVTWMLVTMLGSRVNLDAQTPVWALAGVVGLLVTVAACAAAGPARRAARTDPVAALRSE